MKFDQIYVSPTLEFKFGENFRSKWNLQPYRDIEHPAIFFGLYKDIDINVFLNHIGPSLVIWGGGDMKTNYIDIVKRKTQSGNCFTFTNPGYMTELLNSRGIFPKHSFYISIKEYSQFMPCKLGDKIYVYKGWKGNRSEYFKWDAIVKPIIQYFGEDRILYTDNVEIDELIENYYKKSFIYVKPIPKGGCTTMWELGHMGIRSISNGVGNIPNSINYKNSRDIIRLIKKEESRIGTTQIDLANAVKSVMEYNDDWLKIDYWK